jgi:ribonuclease BN (tRNA processing enzyme)
VVALARDATDLLHEAQYYPEEKKEPKPGWGPISWEEAALLAKEADEKPLSQPPRSFPK